MHLLFCVGSFCYAFLPLYRYPRKGENFSNHPLHLVLLFLRIFRLPKNSFEIPPEKYSEKIVLKYSRKTILNVIRKQNELISRKLYRKKGLKFLLKITQNLSQKTFRFSFIKHIPIFSDFSHGELLPTAISKCSPDRNIKPLGIVPSLFTTIPFPSEEFLSRKNTSLLLKNIFPEYPPLGIV